MDRIINTIKIENLNEIREGSKKKLDHKIKDLINIRILEI